MLDRLERIGGAVELGCLSVEHAYREDVAIALVDTCRECLRLGHEVTRRLAYDDLWSDLDILVAVWDTICDHVAAVSPVHGDAAEAAAVVHDILAGVAGLVDAVRRLDTVVEGQAGRSTSGALGCVDAMAAHADRFFVAALADDRYGRLDAALAVLTTVAARAAKERAAIEGRGR